MRSPRTRILLCDDSRTYSRALARTLEHDRTLEVVGVFSTAEQALSELPRLKPDLVTMDVELPGMSGIDAVGKIMDTEPTPIVVLSDYSDSGSATASAALAAGAIAAIPKGEIDLLDPAGDCANGFRRRIERLSAATVVRHPLGRIQADRLADRLEGRRHVAAIGVCASTGGPRALEAMLGALPATFPIPILLVQHIMAGFEHSLTCTLGRATDLPVRLATDGMRLQPGVWLAPEGAHLRLGPSKRLELVARAPGDVYCPAGDVLLTSLGQTLGTDAVAVVLTGMGRDGARGVRELHMAGGLAIAQDEASSPVFGMPRAALDSGAQIALEPREIGRLLARLQPVVRQPETGMGSPSAEGRPRLTLVR